MKCYSFFEGDSNPTSPVSLNLSTLVPTAHHWFHSRGWLPRMAVYPRVWLPHYSRGTLLVHWRDSVRHRALKEVHTHHLAVFLQGTHVKPHHRKRYSGREGRGTIQNRCCSEDPCQNRAEPNSSAWALPTGLPYSRDPLPWYCQDRGYPLPSCLPGVRNPFTEEQGSDGAVWFWTTDGKLGKRVTNFLQWDGGRWVVRGRKEEIVLFNRHICSSIFWFFFRE